MLDKYLRNGETLHSRLDDLLDQARRSSNVGLKETALREAQVLATVEQTFLAPEPRVAVATLDETVGVYGIDQVAEALDAAFEGGQCPVALRGAVLAILTQDDPDSVGGIIAVGDSMLLPSEPGEPTPMVEGKGHPYLDRSGVDFDVAMPDTLPDDKEPEEFPEFENWGGKFEEPEAVKPKKKGGKKTAAQRAAEEAGL